MGAFSAFYNPATGDTKEEFVLVVNKYVYDLSAGQKQRVLLADKHVGCTLFTSSCSDFSLATLPL